MCIVFAILKWMTLIVWTSVAVRLIPPALRCLTKHALKMDFLWLMVCATSVNRVWKWGHEAVYGEALNTWLAFYWAAAWYAFAIAIGLGFHVCRAWYGDDGETAKPTAIEIAVWRLVASPKDAWRHIRHG